MALWAELSRSHRVRVPASILGELKRFAEIASRYKLTVLQRPHDHAAVLGNACEHTLQIHGKAGHRAGMPWQVRGRFGARRGVSSSRRLMRYDCDATVGFAFHETV